MPFRRPCIDCGKLTAPGKSRCDVHLRTYEAQRTAHRKAAHTGAATRARRAINTLGYGRCRRCGSVLPAGYLEVDHIKPLAQGGRDEDRNLQVLCKDCHREKSAGERRG